MIYVYNITYGIYFKVLKWKKMGKKNLKKQNPSVHIFFSLNIFVCILHLTGRKWKKSVSPWPSINVLTWGCYKGIWTLKPFYDHYQLIGPLGLFPIFKNGSIWINHSDINKRKGSARCPLLNTSYIASFKGDEIFYYENLECIVLPFWLFCEMISLLMEQRRLQPRSLAFQFNPLPGSTRVFIAT